MRLLDTIKSSSDYLEKSGITDPLVDAEILVLHAAGIERLRAYMDNPETDQRIVSRINRLVKRRAAGEPLQYIVGHVDFLGLEIRVGKGVLIPRPETEMLVEEAIKTVKSKALSVKSPEKNPSAFSPQPPVFLDLCTGSGCIALALAREFPDAQLYATDVSAKAIRYARDNADCNGIGNIIFLKGSLLTPVAEHISSFDLITANPPYIRTSDISGLQREVREWEPLRALDGGEDGLDFYRKILSKAVVFLKEGGWIFFELGFGQSEAVAEVAAHAGFKNIELIKDFAGIDRVLKAGKSL
ncbi:MAG: peptide chain release factor N(5)-glutamine methyltransferase [Thermodesulfovibrionales bacterium]